MASIAPLSCAFLKDAFSLHVHGFMVLPDLMSDVVNDSLIGVCKTKCEQEGEAVFNNAKEPGSRQNDKKRLQLSLDNVGAIGAVFKASLTQRLDQMFPRHKVDSMVALLSKPGCKAQLAHTDYTPATLANTTDETMPLACLVALANGTAFDVWPEAIRFVKNVSYKHTQVKLNKGDALVFRGDLVHGGAACGDVGNVRIHAYLDVQGVERPKHGDGVEMTHFMCDEVGILARKK
jgi:ectoine hydroxylase-related dioxygenase (phytanoyl-CoA dioxygenase family)